jgi:ATPase subunit of ABC transporter with duplicated ATPase domains
MVVSNLVEAIVSIKRISSFLDSDELQTDARDVILKENIQDGDELLSITNGEFFWSKDGKNPILQDINLTVGKGELVAVLGQVGAGKVGISLVSFQNQMCAYRPIRPPEQLVVCYYRSDEEDRGQDLSLWNRRICPSEPLVRHHPHVHPRTRSLCAQDYERNDQR